MVVRVVGTRAQPCLARFAALASLSETLLVKGTGDRMVGMMAVMKLLGRVAQLACFKSV